MYHAAALTPRVAALIDGDEIAVDRQEMADTSPQNKEMPDFMKSKMSWKRVGAHAAVNDCTGTVKKAAG